MEEEFVKLNKNNSMKVTTGFQNVIVRTAVEAFNKPESIPKTDRDVKNAGFFAKLLRKSNVSDIDKTKGKPLWANKVDSDERIDIEKRKIVSTTDRSNISNRFHFAKPEVTSEVTSEVNNDEIKNKSPRKKSIVVPSRVNRFKTPANYNGSHMFMPTGERLFWLGETRPSSFGPATYQDFKEIRSRCLSEGRLFEDPEFPATDRSLYYKERLDRPLTWLRPGEISEDPQLFVEGYSRFDVQQGELGDCWLLAAVANLTLHRKLFFQVVPDDQSFDEEYAGVFHFRFWQYGRWVDVVVDDRLPTYRGKLVFLHSSERNEFWSALLEKAYAKLHGSYEALKGGSTCEAMEDFTGGVTEMYEMTELPPNFYTILLKAYERNSLMGCSIEVGVEICNLNPDSLDPEECPEGCTKKWEMSVFEGEWVRGVTAGGCRNYLESFWKNPQYTVTLKDPDEDDAENKCTIIVALMQKNRRSQRHQGLECLTIGFAVYRLPDYGHVPKPLDVNFFKYNASVGRSQAFINLREVSARFKFEPGSYVIVPSTFEPDEEGEFLLRVFSEKTNNMTENDEEVGMGDVDDRKMLDYVITAVKRTLGRHAGDLAFRGIYRYKNGQNGHHDQNADGIVRTRVKEITPNPEPADPVREFFTRLAGSDGEVDWQELKEILDYAMREDLMPLCNCPPNEPMTSKWLCGMALMTGAGDPRPICKEIGIDLQQMQTQPEQVHLNQPQAQELKGQGFSKEVCRSMVAMLDKDNSGGLGFEEFKSLWIDLRNWRSCLEQLLCALCTPICKEIGIDLQQMQTQPEQVHLNQPQAQELKGQGFSKEVCRSMVAMLDKDNSGGLGFEEFKSLWIDLRNWRVGDTL
ncbi:calpain-A isoform 4, partial [Danaus plexippus plexippus]